MIGCRAPSYDSGHLEKYQNLENHFHNQLHFVARGPVSCCDTPQDVFRKTLWLCGTFPCLQYFLHYRTLLRFSRDTDQTSFVQNNARSTVLLVVAKANNLDIELVETRPPNVDAEYLKLNPLGCIPT